MPLHKQKVGVVKEEEDEEEEEKEKMSICWSMLPQGAWVKIVPS